MFNDISWNLSDLVAVFFCDDLGSSGHHKPGESNLRITPYNFEKCRDPPPISIAILLQKYAALLEESSIYTTNLYRGTAPICIAILVQKYSGHGSLAHMRTRIGAGWACDSQIVAVDVRCDLYVRR